MFLKILKFECYFANLIRGKILYVKGSPLIFRSLVSKKINFFDEIIQNRRVHDRGTSSSYSPMVQNVLSFILTQES